MHFLKLNTPKPQTIAQLGVLVSAAGQIPTTITLPKPSNHHSVDVVILAEASYEEYKKEALASFPQISKPNGRYEGKLIHVICSSGRSSDELDHGDVG